MSLIFLSAVIDIRPKFGQHNISQYIFMHKMRYGYGLSQQKSEDKHLD